MIHHFLNFFLVLVFWFDVNVHLIEGDSYKKLHLLK